jgi:hypothetical protein
MLKKTGIVLREENCRCGLDNLLVIQSNWRYFTRPVCTRHFAIQPQYSIPIWNPVQKPQPFFAQPPVIKKRPFVVNDFDLATSKNSKF